MFAGPTGLPVMQADATRPKPHPDLQMSQALRDLMEEISPSCATGMADVATVVWTRALKYDAASPRWPDRDRFTVSARHGIPLLQALLRLSGQDESILAEMFLPAHGLATAIGMAMAERALGARFGKSLVDHRCWVLAHSDELAEGAAYEALCMAGQARLNKLVLLLDVPPESTFRQSDGKVSLRHFQASGWAVSTIDAHDPDQILGALSAAQRSRKPVLIGCRTGDFIHTPGTPRQTAPVQAWRASGERHLRTRRTWLKRLARHPQRSVFNRLQSALLPDQGMDAWLQWRNRISEQHKAISSAAISTEIMQDLSPSWPELAGGCIPSCASFMPAGDVSPRRALAFTVGEQGLAAGLHGMSLHEGLLPVGVALLAGSDTMRAFLRLSAHARTRGLHILVQDPPEAHQPHIDHLAALRAMANVHVFCPADPLETVECWELAVRRTTGPSVLIVSHQDATCQRANRTENHVARGAYLVAPTDGPRDATLIASGTELSTALQVRRILAAQGLAIAVVSLPCWALFAQQDPDWQRTLLGQAPRFGIEAGCGFGWERWLENGEFITSPFFAAPDVLPNAPINAGHAEFALADRRARPYRQTGSAAARIAARIRQRLGFEKHDNQGS